MYVSQSDYENLNINLSTDSTQSELYEAYAQINEKNKRFVQKTFHETYHYWQGLRLPYIYLNSFLDIHTLMKVFMELSKIEENHNKWDIKIPSLDAFTKKHFVNGNLGQLFISNEANQLSTDISVIDLLETATSIAEFQVSVNYEQKSKHLYFSRWYKRNPAYLKVYKLVYNLIEDKDLPISFLIPLINKAFETTKPIMAFIYLLNEFFWWVKSDSNSKSFIAQEEPRNWPYLFDFFSKKIPLDSELDDFNNIDSIFETFTLLSRDRWISSHYTFNESQNLHHPFLYKQAKKWEDKILEDNSYGNLLNFPGYVNKEIRDYTLKYFRPTINFVKFHFKNGLSKILTFGMLEDNEFKYDWPIPMIDLLTIYSVIKRAANIQFYEKHRLCHHINCFHYSNNYCNSYPVIPKTYQDCGFENRVKYLINWKNATK